MELQGPLLLVGCGIMGGALLAGWLGQGLPGERVTVIEPQALEPAVLRPVGYAGRDPRLLAGPESLEAGFRPAMIVFAVKPQQMEAVLPAYRRFAGAGCAVLSIAAGSPIALFESHLGDEVAVIRAMPNTPAAIGRGITALTANARTSARQRRDAEELLQAVGVVEWVEAESLLDAVTAVSGSGPAYVFYFAECLAEAGVAAGLAPELARRLARETVAGAGALIHGSSEPVERLRRNVTSPGGTTQAALEVLMAEDGLAPLVARAVAAAARRSRELAS